MYWSCLRHVLVIEMCWVCFRHVLLMFRTCVAHRHVRAQTNQAQQERPTPVALEAQRHRQQFTGGQLEISPQLTGLTLRLHVRAPDKRNITKSRALEQSCGGALSSGFANALTVNVSQRPVNAQSTHSLRNSQRMVFTQKNEEVQPKEHIYL